VSCASQPCNLWSILVYGVVEKDDGFMSFSEMEKRYQKLRSLFFGMGILAGIFLALITVKNISYSLAAESWPVYEGKFIQGGEQAGFSLWGGEIVKYQYTVNENIYVGTLVGFGLSDPSKVKSHHGPLRVYVNPDDPTMAVLTVGIFINHIAALMTSVFLMWIAFVIWRRTA
jgi:hypothetical protein